MKWIVGTAGTFGPFNSVEALSDRYVADGLEYQFDVIGAAELREEQPPTVAPEPAPVQVPQRVTRRQARQALLMAGLLEQVPLQIALIEDDMQRGLAQIEWEDSQEFERQRPLVVSIGAALGLDAAGLDALFIQAAGL